VLGRNVYVCLMLRWCQRDKFSCKSSLPGCTLHCKGAELDSTGNGATVWPDEILGFNFNRIVYKFELRHQLGPNTLFLETDLLIGSLMTWQSMCNSFGTIKLGLSFQNCQNWVAEFGVSI